MNPRSQIPRPGDYSNNKGNPYLIIAVLIFIGVLFLLAGFGGLK
jgi:hypothetical protein